MLYTSFQKFLDFDKSQWLAIDRQVRKHVPMGMTHRSKPGLDMERDYPWAISTLEMEVMTSSFNSRFNTNYKGEAYTSKWFFELCEKVKCKPVGAVNSVGTLGGGK